MAILTPYQVDPSLLANSYTTGAELGVRTPSLGTALVQGATTGYQTALETEATKARTEVYKQQASQVAVENALKVKELENYDLNNKIQQDYTNAQTLRINSARKLEELQYQEAVNREAEYNNFISQLSQYKDTGNVKAGATLLTSPMGMKFADENPTGYKALMKSFQAVASQSGDTKTLATLGGVENNIQNKKDVAQYNSLKDARDILDSQLNRDNILPGSIAITVNKEPFSLSPESTDKLNAIPKETRGAFFDSDQVKVNVGDKAIKITSIADENTFLEIPRRNPTEDIFENPDYKVLSNIWNQEAQRKVLGGRLNLNTSQVQGGRKSSKEVDEVLRKREELKQRETNYAEGLKKTTIEKDTLFSKFGITNPEKTEVVGDNFESIVSKALGVDVKKLDKSFPINSNYYNRGETPLTMLKKSIETDSPISETALLAVTERLAEEEYMRISKNTPNELKGLGYQDYKDLRTPEIQTKVLELVEDGRAEFKKTAIIGQNSKPLKESLFNERIEGLLQSFNEQEKANLEKDSFYLRDVGDILRKVESSSAENTINYSARSPSGLAVGAYQFQPIRLKELGLLKSITKGGRVSDLENPENWNIEGGLDTFLKDGALQDSVYIKHMEKNRKDLERLGIADKKTPPNILRGMLMAKHLMSTKANSFLKDLKNAKYDLKKVSKKYNGKDANGTSLLEYFLVGAQKLELAEAKQLVRFFQA